MCLFACRSWSLLDTEYNISQVIYETYNVDIESYYSVVHVGYTEQDFYSFSD